MIRKSGNHFCGKITLKLMILRAFFSKNGGDWQKIRDSDGAISVAFGVAKVPETWVIDPNGYVRLRIAGMLTPGLLDDQLAQLKALFGS